MNKKVNLNKLNEVINQSVTSAIAEAKTSKAKASKSKKATKKQEVIQEVAKQQKPSIIEKVISHREVKYIYPDNIQDTLARKKWRQQTRNELRKLEREMLRIQDQNSKEYKAAKSKYDAFQAKVLKVDEAV